MRSLVSRSLCATPLAPVPARSQGRKIGLIPEQTRPREPVFEIAGVAGVDPRTCEYGDR